MDFQQNMRQRILRVAVASAAGFVIPFALLSAVTTFILLPSLAVCCLVLLSAVAAYIPRNGVPIIVSLFILGVVFAVSIFLISPAFSAVPQVGGPVLFPFGSTAVAFVLLMVYGNRRRPVPGEGGAS